MSAAMSSDGRSSLKARDDSPPPPRERLSGHPRLGEMRLVPGGAHRLVVTRGPNSVRFDREGARAWLTMIEAEGPEVARLLLTPLAPWLARRDDIRWLRAALEQFAEEVAFEDRRPDLRDRAVSKMVTA